MEVEIRCAGGGGAGWPVGPECDAGPESRFNSTPRGVEAFGEVASPRGPVRGCVGRRRRRRPRSPRLPLLAGPSSSQRRATPRRARQPAPCPALAHAHPVHVGHRGAPAVGTKAPTMLKPAEPVNGSETPTVDGRWAIAAAAGSPMRRWRVTHGPGRALARRNPSTNCPISHRPRPRGLIREAVRDWGRPGRGSSPRSSRPAPRWSP
jgi:hypothetical protein